MQYRDSHNTTTINTPFSLCLQSPSDLYTTSCDFTLNLSSNKDNSHRKEIKVIANQMSWKNWDIKVPVLSLLMHSPACALGRNDVTANSEPESSWYHTLC